MANIVEWMAKTVARSPSERRQGWGFMVLGVVAGAVITLASLMRPAVAHPIPLFAVCGFFFVLGLVLVLHAGRRQKLEVRFSSSEPYVYWNGQITRYRIGVYNPGPVAIDGVRMELLSIVPRPQAGNFSADFPYPVRRSAEPPPKRNERINADGKPLNASDEELFEPLWFWLSYDNRVMVDGIDTRPIQWDGILEMQEHESWSLRYRISSSQTDPQTADFRVRREGTRVVMERITSGV